MGNLTDIIGYVAGGLTAICFLPQIAHTVRTRRTDDVSNTMLFLSLAAAALYEVYAYRLGLILGCAKVGISEEIELL